MGSDLTISAECYAIAAAQPFTVRRCRQNNDFAAVANENQRVTVDVPTTHESKLAAPSVERHVRQDISDSARAFRFTLGHIALDYCR